MFANLLVNNRPCACLLLACCLRSLLGVKSYGVAKMPMPMSCHCPTAPVLGFRLIGKLSCVCVALANALSMLT